MARAQALAKAYNADEGAVYVDAAKYRGRSDAYVAVVLKATTGELLNAGSVRARTARQVEEAAIALAMSCPTTTAILSDSRSAIASFARNAVCRTTARILSNAEGKSRTRTTRIRWFPAHAGVDLPDGHSNCNEVADAAARELSTCRTAPPRPPSPAPADRQQQHNADAEMEPLTVYGEVLQWYRDGRRAFPPPHLGLTRREAVLLRQMQTKTVLTPALARHVCPDVYEDSVCSVCALTSADLAHLLWGCGGHVASGGCKDLPPYIYGLMSSPECERQLQAVQRLEAALAQQRRKGDPHLLSAAPRGGGGKRDGDPSSSPGCGPGPSAARSA